MPTPLFAVYGATGHTGRLVAAELLARGRAVVLSGRDEAGLRTLAAELAGPVEVHPAPLDDTAALRALAGRAAVLVHCAGPFSVTGDPGATAAVEGGCHYVDHAVESFHVRHLFAAYDDRTRAAGIAMVPGLSFYGGLGDLLASAVTRGLTDVARIVVGYHVRGWRLTTGAKNTAAQLFNETERITFSGGEQHVGYVEPRNAVFPFPPPLGPRSVLTPFPSCDVVTIPRHVPVRDLDLMLSSSTFEEEGMFDSADLAPAARAQSDFTVAVQTVATPPGAAGHASGHDLWRMAAIASVEGAVRLADGTGNRGVLAPAEAFAAEPFLRELEKLGALTLTLGR